MARPITVKTLTADDRADWEPLFRAYVRFYQAAVPDDVIAATFARAVAAADGMHGLLARDARGVAVGMAMLVFHRSTWSPTWYCYLEDLYVAETARGQGVARALFAAIYEQADRRGATRTYWATMSDNHRARMLYDQVGELTPFVQYRRGD